MSAIDSRDTIYSVARSASYAPTPTASQLFDPVLEGEGDGDRNAVAGAVGPSRPGGLFQGMLQSLDQLGLKASSQINPNADVAASEPQQDRDQSSARLEFRAFTQSLLQVLDQFNRSTSSEPFGTQTESQNGEAGAVYSTDSPFGDLSATLKSLAEAIANGGSAGIPATTELQTGFQSLVARLSQENEPDVGIRSQSVGMEAMSRGEQQVSLSNFLVNLSETLVTQRGASDLQMGKTGMLIDQTV